MSGEEGNFRFGQADMASTFNVGESLCLSHKIREFEVRPVGTNRVRKPSEEKPLGF